MSAVAVVSTVVIMAVLTGFTGLTIASFGGMIWQILKGND